MKKIIEQELFDMSEINSLVKKSDYVCDFSFIHVSDIHASKPRKEQVIQVINSLIKSVKEYHIKYVIFSGDFWNSVITNTEASGFTSIVDSMTQLCNIAEVKMIYGTSTHEAAGSLDVFINSGAEIYSRFTKRDYSDCSIIYFPEQRMSNYDGETIKDKQKNMIKEMSALSDAVKNRDYSKPLIVVYHGELSGAVMDNGTKSDSPTALYTRMVKKADYVACGHIHLPQTIDNCRYAGSVPPVDFGEEHDGGYNIVTIRKNRTVDVKRISMGFPVNRTIKINFNDIQTFSKELTNTNVKLMITCTETEKKTLVRKDIKEKLQSMGAVSVLIHTDSVKEKKEVSKEITSVKSLEEKFVMWAKANNVKYSENALKKIHELDENRLIKYMFPQHIFRLVWVDIKGAKGLYHFKDGSMYVDFRDYSTGLIVISGDTGKGKTTFIENCHPFPQMFTREGKLQDQFYLKDSHRIVCYIDENGKYYKPAIYIDPNSSCRYMAETSTDGIKWDKVNQCDGTLESYTAYINETFGTIDVFLRTSFVVNSDSNITDIARASKGELAEFFSKLTGTDYIKPLYKEACENRKKSDKELTALSALVKDQTELDNSIKSTKDSIEKNKTDLSEDEKDSEKCNSELELLKKEKEEAEKISDNGYIEKITKRSESIMIELSEKNATLNAENIYYANKDTISQLTTDIARKSESEKNVSAYTEQINRILSETSELKTKKETLQKDISECSEHILKYNFEIETLSHKIIKDGDKCRECGEIIYKKDKPQLFIDSDKAEKDTETINIKVHELSDTKSSKENGLKDIISKAEKLNDSYHDVKSKLEHEKETVETFSKNIESHSELVPLCGYTPVGKDVLDKAIKELTEEKNTIDAELKKSGTYDIQGIDNKIKSVSENITNIEDDKTKLLIQSGQLISQLSLNEKLSSENLVNVSNMDNEKKENEDWCVICTALSNEGIQSMELKAAVPEIMDTTNTILEKVYGDKFTVRISTDKEGAKKTVTDFTIMVINNENGWEMPLKMVSTGERVWIEQALFYAFSITGTSESGSGFSVRFLDEKDGSLDSELRGRYVEMINASHIAGNAYQTVLITHSQEIKDSVKQVINF